MCRAWLLLGFPFFLAASLPSEEDAPPQAPSTAPTPILSRPATLFSSPSMPLPPELERDAFVVKAGSTRSSFLGKPRPIRLKPYAIRDLATGRRDRDAGSVGAAFPHAVIGFRWEDLQGGFSFRVTDERAAPAELGRVACDWGVAVTSTDVTGRRTGVEARIPGATTLVCEVVMGAGEEPWELHLWTDAPSSLVPPEFPSGGVLARGEVRYTTASTNVVEPAGQKTPRMTGTLFLRENRPVAAVERVLPGRILTLPSLDPAERSLFVAVGAAVLTYDFVGRSATR
jgi:hypothetical protein